MDIFNKALAVQSYCFRGFKDNTAVAARVRECGLSAVELCAVHVDFDEESAFDSVIGVYRGAELAIVSIGVESISRDEKMVRRRFEFARRAGAGLISVAFPVDADDGNYRLAERLCEQYDMRVALHNHGGYHWQGSTQAITRLFNRTGERIGLCLDTAWMMHCREDPVAAVEQFASRLYGVHLKDFVFDRAGKPQDVVVGSGNLDLPRLLATLKRVNFGGPAILEYEGDINNPMSALKECIAAIRAVQL